MDSFTGQTKLHTLLIRTSTSSTAPKTLKIFINRDDLDFSTASELPPTQTLSLSLTSDVQEIGLQRAKFNAVRSVTLFFEDNHSDGEEDISQVGYLGFRGDWMKLNTEAISFLYESAANPSDHVAIAGTNKLGSNIGGDGS
jgi:PITH domain